MGLADAIDAFVTGTYTVTRQDQSDYLNFSGILTQFGSAGTFTIDAAIVPVTGSDLQNLPEGYQQNDVKKLFTKTQLVTGGGKVSGTKQIGDTVSIDSENWAVIDVQVWDYSGDVFYRCMLGREVIG